MRRLLLLAGCLSTGLWAAAALAEVKVRIGEDGIPFIYNESSDQRSYRLSGQLREVRSVELASLIDRHAERQQLSRRLVQAVIQVESGYNPKALSHKGAMGLMQLMPGTARELAVEDPYDPDENIRGGTDYLRQMLDRFGELQLALAAYNAGPGAVERHRGIPPYQDTRVYVRRVLALLDGRDLEIDVPDGPIAVKPRIFAGRDAQGRLVMATTPPR